MHPVPTRPYTRRPWMLDTFCGEGVAAMGYYRAGFDILGVDNNQERLDKYPFPYVKADAVEFLLDHGHRFHARHGSPTCTGYSRGTAAIPDRFERYDRLIAATREAMIEVGGPYVIENVADAAPELRNPLMLCWSMFNEPGSVIDDDGTPLRMERHRLFESNVWLSAPAMCHHPRSVQCAGAYSGARRDKVEARVVRKGGYVPPSLRVLRELVGADWVTERGAFLSVPPAYTEHVGTQLLQAL